MPDLQKVSADKEKILSTIRFKGPSFPARISREIGMQPLFVAALLAELVSERKLKLSNMKVGSSPLYYLENQFPELEKFIDYLGHKERETALALKDAAVLDDESQHPATRVALRKIKDFAIPVNVRINGDLKLYWRYFKTPENETKTLIQNVITQNQQTEQKEITLPEKQPTQQNLEPSPQEKESPPQQEEKDEPTSKEETNPPKDSPSQEKNEPDSKEESEQPKVEKKAVEIFDKPKKTEKSKETTHEFPETIKAFIEKNNLTLLEEVTSKKKEFIAKVHNDSTFGKQGWLLVAKEKKKVTQDDVTIALQKAQAERMPALFVSPGTPDKKALAYAKEWTNLVKVIQL